MALSYLILISSLLFASQISAQSYSDQPIAPVTPSCPTGKQLAQQGLDIELNLDVRSFRCLIIVQGLLERLP